MGLPSDMHLLPWIINALRPNTKMAVPAPESQTAHPNVQQSAAIHWLRNATESVVGVVRCIDLRFEQQGCARAAKETFDEAPLGSGTPSKMAEGLKLCWLKIRD